MRLFKYPDIPEEPLPMMLGQHGVVDGDIHPTIQSEILLYQHCLTQQDLLLDSTIISLRK